MKSDIDNFYVLYRYKDNTYMSMTYDWFIEEDLDKNNYPSVYVNPTQYRSGYKVIAGKNIIDINTETKMKEKYPEYWL